MKLFALSIRKLYDYSLNELIYFGIFIHDPELKSFSGDHPLADLTTEDRDMGFQIALRSFCPRQ